MCTICIQMLNRILCSGVPSSHNFDHMAMMCHSNMRMSESSQGKFGHETPGTLHQYCSHPVLSTSTVCQGSQEAQVVPQSGKVPFTNQRMGPAWQNNSQATPTHHAGRNYQSVYPACHGASGCRNTVAGERATQNDMLGRASNPTAAVGLLLSYCITRSLSRPLDQR